jgi:hypothetical protein
LTGIRSSRAREPISGGVKISTPSPETAPAVELTPVVEPTPRVELTPVVEPIPAVEPRRDLTPETVRRHLPRMMRLSFAQRADTSRSLPCSVGW